MVYIMSNSDLKNYPGKDLFNHFRYHGMSEGRIASDKFNVRDYVDKYPKISSFFKGDWREYFYFYMIIGEIHNCTIFEFHDNLS